MRLGCPWHLKKIVSLVQVIEFLGLLLDILLMVVIIPLDKLNNILAIIITMVKKRKATAVALKSLACKLNFIAKAVPVGRTFIRRIYDTYAGLPSHCYIDLHRDVLAHLTMS